MVTARRRLPRSFSVTEYLHLERMASSRSEFLGGEIFAKASDTLAHSLITSNMIRALGNALMGGPCRVFASNLRLHVTAADLVTYPDASVICGEPSFHDDGPKDTVISATVIVEVLSPSTEAYDRGEKFVAYRAVPSLKHFVLVDQHAARVEVFSAPDWTATLTVGLDGKAALHHLNAQLALGDVYAGLTLAS